MINGKVGDDVYKPAMRVCWGQPAMGHMTAQAHQSQLVAVQTAMSHGLLCGFAFVTNTYLDEARNAIVRHARELDATHLLWVDDDMTVPADIVQRLAAHGRQIVGGVYHQRKPPYRPVAWDFNDRNEMVYLTALKDDGLMQVGGIGTGCLLIAMEVFERVPEPWFLCRHDPDAPAGFAYQFVGEDVDFAYHLKDLQIPVWLDCDVRCGHVTDYEVTSKDWTPNVDD